MTTPCVLYIQRSQYKHQTRIRFNGTTSRGEVVNGVVTSRYSDPPAVYLTIDDVTIDAPDEIDFIPACDWIVDQVKDLGYHVIEIIKPDVIV